MKRCDESDWVIYLTSTGDKIASKKGRTLFSCMTDGRIGVWKKGRGGITRLDTGCVYIIDGGKTSHTNGMVYS